jgi:hypothetical protein
MTTAQSSQSYRLKADEVRAFAERVGDLVLRRQLLAVARDYEDLARSVENLERQHWHASRSG